MSASACIGCGSTQLRVLDSRTVPRGVASDAKPWPRAGTFAICETCGHAQKILDATWQADVARIYAGYEMYFLAGGSEQLVFDASGAAPRTKRLFERLRQTVALPTRGSMLDVGCAVGSTLRTFHGLFPAWKLAGFDITTQSESLIRAIPADFHTGSLDAINERFDLVTMLFVVEHLPDPCRVLEQFRRLVKPGGLIWVHTSDYWANPFDLAVVDHASHFMVDTLAEMVERNGFDVIDRNDDWNAKEMGVVARVAKAGTTPRIDKAKKEIRLAGAPRRLEWLGDVVTHARKSAECRKLAILGTSVAATWLASMMEDDIVLFVDEDRERVSKTHLGRPVVPVEQAADGTPIYLAFPPVQAAHIRARLAAQHPQANFVVPPPIAA